MICDKCNGTGHDKQSKPETRFEDWIDEHGRKRKRHVTVKQGSGCLKCLGRGVV